MRRFSLMFALISSLLITACGSAPAPTATLIVPANTEGGTASVTDDCTQYALEQWLQRASFLTQGFADLINGSLTRLPNQMGEVLEQLNSIQITLQTATRPACAQQHAQLIDQVLTEAIQTLEKYSQGQAIDMVRFVTGINQQVDTVRGIEGQLIALYKTLPTITFAPRTP